MQVNVELTYKENNIFQEITIILITIISQLTFAAYYIDWCLQFSFPD